MESSDKTTAPFAQLTASYKSPSNAVFAHAQKLLAPKSTTTADRTTYLSVLRKATADLQARINSELTQRMDEDKLRASAAAAGQTTIIVDESKEEENYGEEAIEEDS